MKLKFLGSSLVFLLLTLHSTLAQEVKITETKALNKVILIKWKDNVTDHQKDEIKQLFDELVDEVDGFNSITTIDVVSERFETMYILKFNSELAENAYKAHNKHQILVTKGPYLIAGFMEYLYWG